MVSRCFPGGYNVKLHISRGIVSMVVTGFFVLWIDMTKEVILTMLGKSGISPCLNAYKVPYAVPLMRKAKLRKFKEQKKLHFFMLSEDKFS